MEAAFFALLRMSLLFERIVEEKVILKQNAEVLRFISHFFGFFVTVFYPLLYFSMAEKSSTSLYHTFTFNF